jgi:CheY-like chemotaxis protein
MKGNEMFKRILVVDDDAGSQKLLHSILTSKGYEVEVAADGKEVPAKIQGKRPDLIIMDYLMPDVDGIKAVKNILETPALSDIPIIFLTAIATEDRHSGAKFDIKVKDRTFKTLSKPVDSGALLKEVASLIK